VESKRFSVQEHPRPKKENVSKTPISTSKSDVVAYTYNPSYVGSLNRRITVQDWLQAKM
jgi:hypothetical protein